MKQGQRLWTRDELLLAINLYCKLTFGQLHKGNPAIIELAGLVGRTPSSVALKLVNFASLDPSLDRAGMSNASHLDRQVWQEFYADWAGRALESERLLAQAQHLTLEDVAAEYEPLPPVPVGRVKEQLVNVRVNQQFFRRTVLAAYDNTCCITGLRQPALLVAGHIKPWAVDVANRLNPRNGLALNALHDRAFELGLFTIRPKDYVIEVATSVRTGNRPDAQAAGALLGQFHGQGLRLPARPRFLPDPELLAWHRDKWLGAAASRQ
jgi:putative restriction endonuclease